MEDHKAPSIKHLTSDTFGRPPEKENPVSSSPVASALAGVGYTYINDMHKLFIVCMIQYDTYIHYVCTL